MATRIGLRRFNRAQEGRKGERNFYIMQSAALKMESNEKNLARMIARCKRIDPYSTSSDVFAEYRRMYLSYNNEECLLESYQ